MPGLVRPLHTSGAGPPPLPRRLAEDRFRTGPRPPGHGHAAARCCCSTGTGAASAGGDCAHSSSAPPHQDPPLASPSPSGAGRGGVLGVCGGVIAGAGLAGSDGSHDSAGPLHPPAARRRPPWLPPWRRSSSPRSSAEADGCGGLGRGRLGSSWAGAGTWGRALGEGASDTARKPAEEARVEATAGANGAAECRASR